MQVPTPAFRVGQRVRVILNERNTTPHEGWVREILWHSKDQRYNYYLAVPGVALPRRNLSKRYFEEDLVAVPDP